MSDAQFEAVRLGQIDSVHLWEMPVFHDQRGRLFKAFVGGKSGSFPEPFETQEHFFTESKINVFRGMHFQQSPHAAKKIISLVRGRADVLLLDARKESSTYGVVQKVSFIEEAPISIFIPTGVALGYLILAEDTTISYRMDVAFCSNCDAGIDPQVISDFLPISIDKTIRSQRDQDLTSFYDVQSPSECVKKK